MMPEKTGEARSLGKNRKTHFRSLPNRGKNDMEERAKNTRKLRWERLREAQKISDDERLAKCNWSQIGYTVITRKSRSTGLIYFRNVETCSRVWLCPICSAKITYKRQKELLQAVINANILGLYVYMFVFTARHKKYDPVKNVLDLVTKSISRLKGTRFWGRIISKLGIVASCTALETTFSIENGAHVHKHILEFCERKLSDGEIAELRDEISREYQKKLKALGGSAQAPYDVQIKTGADYLAEYIAKFGRNPKDEYKAHRGISYEMTKLPNKMRSMLDGHYTPFQLLDLSRDGDKWARAMWRKYQQAFWRKSQLTWSRGARELLGLEAEKTDAEIANQDEPDNFDFCVLQKEGWHITRKIPFEYGEAAKNMSFREFAAWCKERGIVIEKPFIKLASEWGGKSITLR